MTYLVYVAFLGTAAVIFLWLRDARIYYRTGLPGYRAAAYRGVAYGALSMFGLACGIFMMELLGLGLILAALYLQGKMLREKVWGGQGAFQRFCGSAPVNRANKK
ncbi:MAG: ABC transporter permease [Methanoregula sp.]|nr:MAG: ABC transporter permease [Methanoregula sp.]